MTSLQTLYAALTTGQNTELELDDLMNTDQLSSIQSLLKSTSLKFTAIQNARLNDNLLSFQATFSAFDENAKASVYVLETSKDAKIQQECLFALQFTSLTSDALLDAYKITETTGTNPIASPITVGLKSQALLYSTLSDVSAYATLLKDFLSTTNIAAKDIKAGFNFEISATPKGVLQEALDLIEYSNQSLDINGYLTMGFRPTFETTFNLNLTTPVYDGLSLTLARLSLYWDLTLKALYNPQIGIDGSVKIGATTTTFRAGLNLNNHQLYLDFKNLPSFGDLADALSMPADPIGSKSSNWPSSFEEVVSDVSKLELSELGLLLDLKNKTRLQAWFSLTTTAPLELLEDKISISPVIKVKATHTVSPATTSLEANINGVWEINAPAYGNQPAKISKFNTSVSLPDLDFSLDLAVGSSFSLACFESVFGESPFFRAIEDITLLTMSVQGNFREKSLSIQVSSFTNWRIYHDGISLAISNLGFSMDYSQGALQNISFSGTGEVEDMYFSVNAAHDSKGWKLKGSGYMAGDFDMSQWISSWPGPALATEMLTRITGILPPFKITGINFSYDQSTAALSMDATASFEVSAQLSPTPLSFQLSAARSEDANKKLSWVVSGNSHFQQPLSLANVLGDVLGTFKISGAMPTSITNLAPAISQLSFSYNTSDDTFDFGFTLSNPASISGIIGKKEDASPHTFSTFHLTRTKSNNETKTVLTLSIDAGVKLSDLLDLQGDLPGDLNPTFDTLHFSLAVDHDGGDSPSSSDSFSFSTTFTDSGKTFKFSGVYSKTTTGSGTDQATVKSFGGNISGVNGASLDLGSDFPIQLDIKDLFIAKISTAGSNNTTQSFTLYGAGITVDADFNLSSLPVVGEFLKEAKFSFNALRFTYSKTSIAAKDLDTVNNFLGEINVAPLVTAQSSVANNNTSPANFPKGFSLQGSLVLGNNAEVIPLHTSMPSSKDHSGKETANPATAQSPATPSPVGKKFGPVNIKDVSLGLSGGKVVFKFTGGLQLGPLALNFIGFEVESPVDGFSPTISLQGLGLNINKPPLSLEGLFMEGSVDVPEMDYATGKVSTVPVDAYSGSLSIGYNQYALTAIGSYAKLPDDTTTVFLYGFLGAPLGGPPFLFVTGVAAGFGYNREFRLPEANTINTFPLIQPVMPGNTGPFDFSAMNTEFLPKKGDFWGAVGIRAETFKMIESFVLLALRFDPELEIDIIGMSDMQFPRPDEGSSLPPLAKIKIGVVARIIPERGVVAVNGAFLPGSYVLNPLAHISGGFAMLSVFKDQTAGQWKEAQEGDFVITIGGYAASYKPKPYYPRVSRLQMNWQVSSALSLKAQAYFAITPQAMMAGGYLAANFQEGGTFSIHVAFTVGADFIIYWKPFHYAGDMYAELDVTASVSLDCWLFTIHMSVALDLGADLSIWGPDFSGHATVYIHVLITFSASVSFGGATQTVQPIGWSEFSNSFLPEADKIITVNISKGLVASQSSTNYQVVNAKELNITCGSAIPVKELKLGGLVVGETLTLPSGNGKWSSNNKAIASVDSNGKVTGISEGTATITNPAGKEIAIEICKPPSLPDILETGSPITLDAPQGKSGTWRSSDKSIATVDSATGTVTTAKKAGKVTISYETSDNLVVYQKSFFVLNESFGIKPMANTAADFSVSELRISVIKDGKVLTNQELSDQFDFELVTRNMPSALWEPAENSGTIPDNDGEELITGLTNGIRIAARPPKRGTSFDAPVNQEDDIHTPPADQAVAFSYGSGFSLVTN